MSNNPFGTGTYYNGHQTYIVSADERVKAVKNFDADQCWRALAQPGLQATVKKAIEARLRKLGKEGRQP